jgi:hypothetical protein
LSDQQLNASQSINNTGIVRRFPPTHRSVQLLPIAHHSPTYLSFFLQMFEKFSIRDVDSAGRGGEYTVQTGFGWTNGVVLWIASVFGDQLVAPVCPDPLFASSSGGGNGSNPSNRENGTPRLGVAPRVLFGPTLIAAALQLLVV